MQYLESEFCILGKNQLGACFSVKDLKIFNNLPKKTQKQTDCNIEKYGDILDTFQVNLLNESSEQHCTFQKGRIKLYPRPDGPEGEGHWLGMQC